MEQSESDKKADAIIQQHLGFAMAAGAIPIPVIDIVAVTAVQVDMLHQLADLYGVDFNTERGKSIASALAGSVLGTSLGRYAASFVKAVPGVGTWLGIGSQVILAGASTFALGKVFQNHFQNRGNLFDFSFEAAAAQFAEFFNLGKSVAEAKQKAPNPQEVLATVEKLAELKKKGAISEEEFNKAKQELLKQIT